ncbi:MAG: PmoA family protein [Pirellulaceae bacterium]|nr:PmoA family protein [Pirellulaceae bacterium]
MNLYPTLSKLLFFGLVVVSGNCLAIEPGFVIEQQSDRLVISLAGQPVATYVFRDQTIPRPYFAHVHVGSGQQVTRNHPPVPGIDSSDHATLHPGIWMAFGDLSGCDFWRNKDPIVHEAFVEKPQADDKQASFAVRNRYQRADGTLVCRETCRFSLINSPFGCWLLWDSVFDGESEFFFGDQEEMGLGMRVSTAISVKQNGTMLDSEGRRNEKEIWGNTTNWCDYSGVVDGQRIGMTLMCHPKNFRPSRMHARDYGFLTANPFGQKVFDKGERSKVIVKPGETLRLRYGLLLHGAPASAPIDLSAAYALYLKQSGE